MLPESVVMETMKHHWECNWKKKEKKKKKMMMKRKSLWVKEMVTMKKGEEC